ncbi:glyoxylase-like metal-dependent hydrolase (beta-lactamase superfamily II) [Blastomonas natatoria]|uniref:Glyoxylase-like metal-dependent hydrolase (Beta-lactamase superfamily II) n=1 Tax=Blastomonas natatoria TaxID=34015 RepID=A0A2V3V9I6_9SPHN|nr:MBL fold metallo-hydrolase [Blastomonas natatoria]PXW77531.1 glyoxylase-like metal-dependent hydrolase (beta-lactamase superfamily II) [Blastomonas natatoria]
MTRTDAVLDTATEQVLRAASDAAVRPEIASFFDPATFTVTYVVHDPATMEAAVVDSVLDFDPNSGRTATASADRVIDYITSHNLKVIWLLETHAHADHFSAAPYLQEKLGGKIAIGANITTVQNVFGKLFNAGTDFERDGSQFDALFRDGDTFTIGSLPVTVMHVPGHTPADIAYVVGEAVFVGDTMFMPDYGTARADFPGGDARQLFRSLRRILSLPPETRLFMCHDYLPKGRTTYVWETTVAAEREGNIHAHDGITEDEFVQMREARDATLDMPRLILPSVQVNMRAGHFPPPDDNGVTYLKIPVNAV